MMEETVQERIREAAARSLAARDALYDPERKLLGKYDPSVYPEAYRREHFGAIGPNGLHPYRESLYYALTLLECGSRIPRARDILETFCRDAVLPDGQLLWFAEEKHLRDANGNFFNAAALLPLEAYFSEQLAPETARRLREILKNLYPVFAGERNRGSLTYVNPQLGGTAMCCALAERFALPSFENDVSEFLNYGNFLLNEGISETLTPTYYGVDLFILCGLLCITHDRRLTDMSLRLLRERILRQMRFFGERFPVPFRRGYNGMYAVRNTGSLPAWIFGWTKELRLDYDHISPFLFEKALELFPCIETAAETELPRTQETVVFRNCRAASYLDRTFSLGSFNRYPCETIVWQTVNVGGSGWQDGPVYLTFENARETSGILRLEAVDSDGRLQTHPYAGKFTLEKTFRLFPFRSFPPEPQLRCTQSENRLLCLFQTDRIDAVLRRFGFNFHFSRIGNSWRKLSGGNLLAEADGSTVLLHAFRRVDMAGSTLLKAAWIEPEFTVVQDHDSLDCRMDHCDGSPQSFVQSHVCGGFYLEVLAGIPLGRAEREIAEIHFDDRFVSDRCNGHVDDRDAIRETSVVSHGKRLSLRWNQYTNESESN